MTAPLVIVLPNDDYWKSVIQVSCSLFFTITVCLFCIAGRQVGPDHICREKLEKTIILFTKVVSSIIILMIIILLRLLHFFVFNWRCPLHVCLSALPQLTQLLDFLESHPYPFIPLIQCSLEFAVSYVFTPVGEGVTFERFIVQCMNLIKMIVKNDAYKPAKNIDGKRRRLLE